MFAVEDEPLKKDERILEPVEAFQAVAWMDVMYEDSGLEMQKAHEAATIIQVTLILSNFRSWNPRQNSIFFNNFWKICNFLNNNCENINNEDLRRFNPFLFFPLSLFFFLR